MKTPVSSIGMPGLILALASISVSFSQTDSNGPAVSAAGSSPRVFPAITAPQDVPSFPLPESGAAVLKRQPPKIRLSPWTSEIVKLAESGIDEDVILSFIENSGTFNLSADQIVYLNDLGLSSELITAMLRHDQEIISGLRPLTTASEPDWELPIDMTSTPRKQPALKTTSPPATAPTQSPTPAAVPV